MRLWIFIFFIYLCNLTAQETPVLQELSLLKEELTFFSDVESQEAPKREEDFELNLEHFTPSFSADCEPLAIVAGCVNVISGSFFQKEMDLQGTTLDPIHFVRTYDSSCMAHSFLGLGFSSSFPLWASQMQKSARHSYGVISERGNAFLLYRNKEKGPANVYYIDPRLFEKGYTNFSHMQNLINWKAIFRSSEWRLTLGDGTQRIYRGPIKLDKAFRSKLLFPTKSAYLLKEEIKPNGNVLLFDYSIKEGGAYLKSIQTLNRTRLHVLNKLSFHHKGEEWTVEDEGGNFATFYQEEKIRPYTTGLGVRPLQKNILKKVSSSQKKEAIFYAMRPLHVEVEEIQKPGGNFLKLSITLKEKLRHFWVHKMAKMMFCFTGFSIKKITPLSLTPWGKKPLTFLMITSGFLILSIMTPLDMSTSKKVFIGTRWDGLLPKPLEEKMETFATLKHTFMMDEEMSKKRPFMAIYQEKNPFSLPWQIKRKWIT